MEGPDIVAIVTLDVGEVHNVLWKSGLICAHLLTHWFHFSPDAVAFPSSGRFIMFNVVKSY